MINLLPSWPLLSTFVAASLILAITPGPGVFFIVTRSLTQGRAFGLASVGGVALGNFGNAVGASIGLAAVLAISSTAYDVVKYAGAAYLVFLGVQALRWSSQSEAASTRPPQLALSRTFLDGAAVALLNPKTALFFGAFLPQFLSAEATSLVQSVMLGGLFVTIAATTDSIYALAAATFAPALNHKLGLRHFWGRYLQAGALIGLGLFTAVSSSSGL